MKKFLAFVLVCILCVAFLAGCNNSKGITQDDAQKIAIEELGVDKKDVESVHIHGGTYGKLPCYNVHVTVDGHSHEVVVDAATGDVLHTGDSSH